MAKKPFPFKVCEQCCEGGGSGNGLSAYEIAVKNGFKGTESEWLESLKGKTPVKGEDYLTPDDVEQLNATPKEFVIFNDGYGAGEITLYTSSEGLHLKIEDGNGVKYNGLLLSAKNKQIQADCDTDGNPFKTHYAQVGGHVAFASVTFPGTVSIIGREDGDLWIEYDSGYGYRQQKLYDHSTNQICGSSVNAEKDANGNIIHEHYATKEELQAPKEVVQLTRGIRFVVDKDGLWVIREGDGYTEKKLLYDSSIDSLRVDYARESATAGQASEDTLGNIITDTYATKEELKAPKEVIEFSNGIKFFATGTKMLELIYNGHSRTFYDAESNWIEADKALYAESAMFDSAENNIVETYATKEEVDTKIQTYIDEAILGGEW